MSEPRNQLKYNPKRLVGETVEELRAEMQLELDRMANVLEALTDFSYNPQGKEPKKFKEGSIRFFISGVSVTGISSTVAGLHQFRGGSWRRLSEV